MFYFWVISIMYILILIILFISTLFWMGFLLDAKRMGGCHGCQHKFVEKKTFSADVSKNMSPFFFL